MKHLEAYHALEEDNNVLINGITRLYLLDTDKNSFSELRIMLADLKLACDRSLFFPALSPAQKINYMLFDDLDVMRLRQLVKELHNALSQDVTLCLGNVRIRDDQDVIPDICN